VEPLRQTVLQLAVRGKLVPQDPSDEPATGLLGDRVHSARNGRTVPPGWTCSSLSLLGEVVGGGTPSKSTAEFWKGELPWVSPKDMKCDVIGDAQDHISEAAVEKSSVKLIPPGALLMVVRGMILAHSFPTALTSVKDMKALIPFRKDIAHYLQLLTRGEKQTVLSLVERSTHGTCKLPTDALFSLPLPIPPLAEQHRIVAKVAELMGLLGRLEERLRAARDAQAAFAAAAVHDLDR
jgi:type I restriction enzyme S subunit